MNLKVVMGKNSLFCPRRNPHLDGINDPDFYDYKYDCQDCGNIMYFDPIDDTDNPVTIRERHISVCRECSKYVSHPSKKEIQNRERDMDLLNRNINRVKKRSF